MSFDRTIRRGFAVWYAPTVTEMWRYVYTDERSDYVPGGTYLGPNGYQSTGYERTRLYTIPAGSGNVLLWGALYKNNLIVFYSTGFGAAYYATSQRINDFGSRNTTTDNVTENWTTQIPIIANPQFKVSGSDLEGGTFGWRGEGSNSHLFNILNLDDGSTYTIDNSQYQLSDVLTPISWQMGNQGVWNSRAGYYLAYSTTPAWDATDGVGWSKVFVGRNADNDFLLADVLRWLALADGQYTAGDIVTSGITDTVKGAYIEQSIRIWAVLRDIANAFRIDIFESEGKLKFVYRAPGSVSTPDFTVLGTDRSSISSSEAPDDDNPSIRSIDVPQEQLPSEIELRYLDPDIEYQVGAVRRKRTRFPASTTDSDEVEVIEIPIIMTYVKALVAVTNLLVNLWNTSKKHEFRLLPKDLAREPSDVGSVTVNGFTFLVKLTEATINGDFSLSCVGKSFVNEVIAIPVGGLVRPGSDGQTIAAPSFSQVLIFDLISSVIQPTPNASASTLLVGYLPTSFGQAGWQGANAFISDDASLYTLLTQVLSGEHVIGKLQSPLLASPSNSTVEDTIILEDYEGDLNTVALDGTFGFLGSGDTWEVVSFNGYTDNMDGTLTLTAPVYRGIRGTEYVIGTTIGQQLFVPGETAIRILNLAQDDLLTVKFLKAVGLNEDADTVAPVAFPIEANGMKAWAPRDLKAYRTTGPDGVRFEWTGRTRQMAADLFTDPADLDLLSDKDEYDIEIRDPASPSTILATIEDNAGSSVTYNTSAFLSYTEATFTVYQLNDLVGRGIPRTATVIIEE